jgi:AraC-like DNA-binding protein
MNEPRATVRDEGVMGLRGWIGHGRGMSLAHRHLDLEINYVLSGTISYLVGGRIVTLPEQRMCLLWAGIPHQVIRGAAGAEMIWVTIPLALVLRWGLPDKLIRPLLTHGFLEDPVPRTCDVELLREWLCDLPRKEGSSQAFRTDPSVEQIVMLEIEARLRRFARGLNQQQTAETRSVESGEVPTDRGLGAVEAMAQFICANFRTEIGVSDIAREARLHPNYAMTLFRRHTGMSVSQYVTMQRVAHAQRRLATSDDAIQEIAVDSGFGSISRFYEAFRRQTGNTPRHFRLQMTGSPQ